MDTGPRIDGYQWRGGREAMLRFGSENGPVVVAALPLLEEANRTRAFVAAILRALATRGVGGALPDLPGQGESLEPTAAMTLVDLRAAFAAAVKAQGDRPAFALSVRSGALLTEAAAVRGHWSLAPQTGAEVLKEWRRLSAGRAEADSVEVAGNLIPASMMKDLIETVYYPDAGRGPVAVNDERRTDPPGSPQLDSGVDLRSPSARRDGTARVVRLNSDPREADLKIDGTPLWRRAEPDNDLGLAQRLAADIADWIATCGS